MTMDLAEQPVRPVRTAAADHFVQFYQLDEELVPEVARFLRNGLEAGLGAIMIATPEHAAAVCGLWEAQGFDHRRFAGRRQLLLWDAAEILDSFLRDGELDSAAFEANVGSLVREHVRRYGNLVAFGEMVALLAAKGNHEAALGLEDLWNRLAESCPFALYCAYPLQVYASAGATASFKRACKAHAHVLPASGLEKQSEADLVLLVAELQQKTLALRHEVEERKRIADMLHARERELSDFLENVIVGLHRVAADGTILWANRAELQMLGYEAHEFVGRNVREFHVDQVRVGELLDTLRAGGCVRDQPAKLIAKDGSLRHVLITSNAHVEDGKFISTRCVTRDVTDRWLAQEALRERTAILHLAMQAGRMGYWVADTESGTVRLSQQTAEMLGLDAAAELSMDALAGLLQADDALGFAEFVEQVCRTGKPGRCRFRVRGSSKELEARGEAVISADGASANVYGVCLPA